jgi:hypothetical protein
MLRRQNRIDERYLFITLLAYSTSAYLCWRGSEGLHGTWPFLTSFVWELGKSSHRRFPSCDRGWYIWEGTLEVLSLRQAALLERGKSAHLPRISLCRSLASQADRQTIQSQDMAYRIKCRPLRLVYEYRDLNNVPVVKTSLEFHTVEASDGSAGRLLPVGKSIKTTVKISSNKAVR